MDPDSFNLSPSRKHNTSQISCHYLDTFLPPIWGYISQLVTFVSAVFVVVPLSGTCMSHFNRLYSYMGINRFTLKSGTCNCLFSKFLYWKYYSGQLFIIFFVTYKYGCFFFSFYCNQTEMISEDSSTVKRSCWTYNWLSSVYFLSTWMSQRNVSRLLYCNCLLTYCTLFGKRYKETCHPESFCFDALHGLHTYLDKKWKLFKIQIWILFEKEIASQFAS